MSIPIAHRNTFHFKDKLFLGVASVAASIALILLIMGLQTGLYSTLTAFIDNIDADLIVAQSGVKGLFSSNSALALDIHEEILDVVNASEAGHILVSDVIFTRNSTKTPVVLVGYEPETNFGSPWKLGEGRLLLNENEIILDSWLAERSQARIGEKVSLLGGEYTVVGFSRETASWMSPYVFLSLDAAEAALGLKDTVSFHLIRLANGADLNSAKAEIEEKIPGVEALTPKEIGDSDRRVLATVMDTPIAVILVISVIIGVAVISLTAYTSVSDRIREYGVLKAIGASNVRLARLVIKETFYLSVFGFIIGIGLAFFAANIIISVWPQFNIIIEWQSVLQLGFLTLFMSILAALLPINRLSQLDPQVVFKQ